MGFKVRDLMTLLCLCGVGIQTSYAFVAEMRDIQNNCAREGGFCIHTIPPPAPRRRGQRRRGNMGPTRTRKGSRPDPRNNGQAHVRLPASMGGGAAQSGGQQSFGYPANPTNTQNNGNTQGGFFFGSTPNDPFNLMSAMMFTRKKRQAAEPMDPADIPRIRRGENVFNFLNRHCRKSEFDFGCRQSGGMCCLPFL